MNEIKWLKLFYGGTTRHPLWNELLPAQAARVHCEEQILYVHNLVGANMQKSEYTYQVPSWSDDRTASRV
jgi:hypothetical protein